MPARPTEEVVGTCKVCNGDLIRSSVQVYRGDPMHMIIGPGSRNQFRQEVSIFCSSCGISYHHIPKKDRLEDER